MSTSQLRFPLALLLSGLFAGSAWGLELKSFKDSLFAYPAILETTDNGDRLVVDYQEMRDINGRDETPERRVKSSYVSLGVKKKQVMETVAEGGRAVDVARVGAEVNATFAVIFLHGRGGDRRLGVNDYSFGGNFNRIKNLAVDNGGAYYSASVKSFDGEGVADVAALIASIRAKSPAAKIVLSCASMGSIVCWGIAQDKAASAQLSGMMVMGGVSDPDFAKTPAFKRKLPMFFSHGSSDPVYAAGEQEKLYASLHAKAYPARFVLFNTGSHGTPVRMTDWRDALNWIFSR